MREEVGHEDDSHLKKNQFSFFPFTLNVLLSGLDMNLSLIDICFYNLTIQPIPISIQTQIGMKIEIIVVD